MALLQSVNRYVGILANESGGVPPFAEKSFYERFCREARDLGFTVYVFSPAWVKSAGRRVRGFTYSAETDGWREGVFPLPDLIYDRFFPTTRMDTALRLTAVRRMAAVSPVRFLGRGLRGKWEAFVFLRRDPELSPYLPKTERFRSIGQLLRFLEMRNKAFLKPQFGTHGKGALFISNHEAGFTVRARDAANRPIERRFEDSLSLAVWVKQFIGRAPYLLQEYLTLTSSNGSVFDIRSLVQKNGKGRWEVTGMAVRQGESGSITSNLHGGGTAHDVRLFLVKEYGETRAGSIMRQLQFLSERIPPVLEASNGRMAELGIDLGVDRGGKVWIIEVNSKPGRSVFHRLARDREEHLAATNPAAYAGHLLRGTIISGRSFASHLARVKPEAKL